MEAVLPDAVSKPVSIRIVEPPDGTDRYVGGYLANMLGGGGFLTRGSLRNVAHEKLRIAAPHPVFNLALDQVRNGGSFESAQMTGWRYLVLAGGKVAATVELAATSAGEPPRFSRITDSWMAQATLRAIRFAEKSPGAKGGNFVLGMLRAPSIQAHALWLRHEKGDGRSDLFLPLKRGQAAPASRREMDSDGFMTWLVEARAGISRGNR